MTPERFVRYMIETFGVPTCFDNIDEDNTIEEEGYWFESPCCQELILFEDYPEAFKMGCICPICEEPFED